MKAISRVETFSFFNKIPFSYVSNSFKNIVITFNPVMKKYLILFITITTIISELY